MKTLKRSAVLLLAAAMLLGCFTITAYAGSETYTGSYNGYNYTTTLLANPSGSSATIIYNKSGVPVIVDGSVTYYNSLNRALQTNYLYNKGSSSTSASHGGRSDASYATGNCKYYISGTLIQSLYV